MNIIDIFCLYIFLVDPFILPYCFHRIRRELIDVFSIIVYIQSTFCPTLDHHQGRIYYIDVILTECNLSLHAITSVFQSAVIFMSCRKFVLINEVCINEEMLPKYTYFKLHDPVAHKYNSTLECSRSSNLCSSM